MAIARKPKKQPAPAPVNVDALIAKGGSVPQTTPPVPVGEKTVTSFTLRVPHEMLETLDAQRKRHSYKVPRHQWILEAIMQRLERETRPPTPHIE